MARTILASALTALVVALLVGTLPRSECGGSCTKPEAEDEATTARIAAVEARLAELEGRLAQQEAPAAARDAAAAPTPARTTSGKTYEQWLQQLRSPNESEAFTAALKLAKLQDPRATVPLIETLKTHRDYYVRLAAATALGELGALDAVPALIDAFDEEDALVRTAAADAFQSITGEDTELRPESSPRERQEIQATWRAWWKENEARLRAR